MLLLYLLVINLLSIVLCVADKRKAIKSKRRIPEKVLFSASIFGGALFMYITMKTIRHKTLHKRFMIGLPLIILLQALLLLWLIYKGILY